ncbi:MAG TPA: hypothetical protein VND02_04870, partial [Actinomycetota bacterium]|nr:hypothetical protein [Actinomycetota bacterium]
TRSGARLNHPGAVTLYDVVTDHGGTFIVMELINAPTLADLVRSDGPLPVGRGRGPVREPGDHRCGGCRGDRGE